MPRRGEGQFVCAEVGLRHNPKLATLARALGVSRNEAVGMLVAWREFVLTCGTGAGVLRGYSLDDVATYLDWGGRTPKLVGALKLGGFLAVSRGRLSYPHWLETPTGEYAKHRADVRAYDRRRKAERKGEGEGVAPETSNGHPPDVRRSSDGIPTEFHPESGDQSIKDSVGTPPGPPEGGRESLSAWFLELYPKVRNPKKIRRLIDQLSDDEVVQLRYCLPLHAPSYVEKKKGKGWRFVPFGDSYLEDAIYWEFRPPKPAAPKAVEVVELETAKRDEEERERQRAFWQRRAQIRSRLIAEGVPKDEIEARLIAELDAPERRPS